ncbi:excinuclease ABC subunit UvrA [Hydrogenophilus thiooxidans]|uniref:excinuclease ABC subunit UvrA n=1 Tax=Hydrogenophilus thiooxidans TaxID=2820326 RepID=UPI001C2351CE|nr:excinuclease ABC subunit UvrA [Hydrogenophilus thiooxidans]
MIRVIGARQNNLKELTVTVPTGRLVAITGVSGAGKSSLALEILYAEGQRRYVETFSPYARQFFERLDPPDVDAVERILPAVRIEAGGAVRTSRATVGTLTEIDDLLKVIWAQAATWRCPRCDCDAVRFADADAVWSWCAERLLATHADNPAESADAARVRVAVAWPLLVPANWSPEAAWRGLAAQGFSRVLGATPHEKGAVWWVVSDRLRFHADERERFVAAVTAASARSGTGVVLITRWDAVAAWHASEGELPRHWEPPHDGVWFVSLTDPCCPRCGEAAPRATPALFSYNNPLGACPTCRGFGDLLEIDWDKVIPDPSRTLADGAIRPWQSGESQQCQTELEQFARARGVPLDVPWAVLPEAARRWVIEGDPEWVNWEQSWPRHWYGVRRYFEWLESRSYKMHMRVLLSRYRTSRRCPACHGTRLTPAALAWRLAGTTIAAFREWAVRDARAFWETLPVATWPRGVRLAWEAARERLRYLDEVGLGYLTLARAARTLSGGELQRIRLTTALGVELTQTLFVLEEPTAGLHARDVDRVIAAMRRLVVLGNTVVVIEHDPQVIAAADWVIDLGPGSGERGGSLVFAGPPSALAAHPTSRTGHYLRRWHERWAADRNAVASATHAAPPSCVPDAESPVRAKLSAPPAAVVESQTVPNGRAKPAAPTLTLSVRERHNLRDFTVTLPLTGLTVIAGVSGSGKSTLVEEALVPAVTAALAGLPLPEGVSLTAEWDGRAERGPDHSISLPIAEVLWVDQSPLTKSARSVPVTVLGVWDGFRKAFAQSDAARQQGLNAAAFSFNSGAGRCPACQGAGYTRIEMQFLADVYLKCPVCDGKRFRSEVLQVTWLGANVAEWLAMTVDEAIARLATDPVGNKLVPPLAHLAALGLGYLRLGQPTPTLAGGEAQRLKLAAALAAEKGAVERAPGVQKRRLIVLDEPTTGLHEAEVAQLLAFLRARTAEGDAVVVVEHHREVIAAADWVIELGPEGGEAGGRLVFAGPPALLATAATATAAAMRGAVHSPSPLAHAAAVSARSDTGANGKAANDPQRLRVAEAPTPYAHAELPSSAVAVARVTPADGANPTDSLPLPPAPPPAALPSAITVIGAREHNLKGIDVTIPHGRFTVITGRSGSGKSTLAFDILFAEGQRRYLLALDAYARQFVQPPPPPAVDRLTGLPPTAAIEQRTSRGGWKSTVATLTELSPYLRLLWTKLGVPHCPNCNVPAAVRSAEAWAEALWASGTTPEVVCAALVRRRKGVYQDLADWAAARGYETLFVDGVEQPTHPWQRPDRYREHDIDLPVARRPRTEPELAEALAAAWRLADGWAKVRVAGSWQVVSAHAVCPACGEALPPLDPRLFSNHSPLGWCTECLGTGRLVVGTRAETDDGQPRSFAEAVEWETKHVDANHPCPACHGSCLNAAARAVAVAGLRWEALERMTIAEVAAWLDAQEPVWQQSPAAAAVVAELLPGLRARLRLLDDVGVSYLTLDRAAPTLSGGEAQRIRLAAQLGVQLNGVAYILDEPTIGLHPQDDARLIGVLKRLRDQGATVVVVEHDARVIESADWVIDLGPGAGEHGGEVVASGPPEVIRNHPESLTGRMLRDGIPHRLAPPRDPPTAWLTVHGACANNLTGFDVAFPLNRLTVVAGVSGSGKSTLIHEVLAASLTARRPIGCRAVENADAVARLVVVDQSPIGKTSRSCPATYLKCFDPIRALFAATPEAKARGFRAGFFSFNSGEGRCPVCNGNGWVAAEMAFLPTVREPCDACGGSRYRSDALAVRYRGKTIAEVLMMTAEEAAAFFAAHPTIAEPLRLMTEVGLGYLRLGQTSATLSGGEAQRLKLVAELANRAARPTLYLFDEPTVGLHLADVALLLPVLHRLVDAGHTVVVIEHDRDVWQEADWFIELGPTGGRDGGRLLYAGPFDGVVAAQTPSGRALAGSS